MSLLIPVILFAGFFIGLMALLRRRIVRTLPSEPSCGRCGYCVVGLEGTICPECGSDLRDVGIITPNQSKRPFNAFALFALIWSVGLLFVAISASSLIASRFPYVRTMEQYRAIFCQSPYLNTIIDARETAIVKNWGTEPATTPTHLTLAIHLLGSRPQQMDVDLKTKAYEFAGANGQVVSKPSGFGTEALIEWLPLTNSNPNDPRVRERATEIITCIDELTNNAASGITEFSESKREFGDYGVRAFPAARSIRPSNWLPLTLLIFWILVWMIGVLWIMRRYSRAELAQRRDQAVSLPVLP